MAHAFAEIAAWLFGHSVTSAAVSGATFCALFMTLLAIYPVLSFLAQGWNIKKKDIFSSFGTAAKRCYLGTFQKTVRVADPHEAFEVFYRESYGRWRFAGPLLLLLAVCFPLMFLFSETAVSQLLVCAGGTCKSADSYASNAQFAILLQPVAAAGMIGGYVWVVAGFISQNRQFNLSPSDVMNGALRLAVSAAIGYAVSSLLNPSVGPFVAFAAGAFPLATVNVLLRRLASKQMGLEIEVTNQPDQITSLDGVDTLTADHFHSAGITTIPQLAYCDPVQLCMRTGLGFDFVSDASAQALAWNYLGDKLKILKICGLRTSIEIKNLCDGIDSDDEDAVATLAAAATLLSLDIALFHNVCKEIAGDPYTVFLAELWSNTLEDESRTP